MYLAITLSVKKPSTLRLALARKLNHPDLEVEHVAISMLQNSLVEIEDIDKKKVEKILHVYLVAKPRIIGVKKVTFGARLDKVLDECEEIQKVVDEQLLWGKVKGSITSFEKRDYF